ncbi:hypothetical protein MBANPS3_009858 [Mucor bainieri]
MPLTNFDTLCIISGHSIGENYDDMDNAADGFGKQTEAIEKINRKISITHNQMNGDLENSQLLQQSGTALHSDTLLSCYGQDNFQGWPNTIIGCNSLQTVKLDLGGLFVELNLHMEKPVKDDHDWTHSVEAALLKDLYDYE